eukprot:499566-Hanusia_phi.AAC.7
MAALRNSSRSSEEARKIKACRVALKLPANSLSTRAAPWALCRRRKAPPRSRPRAGGGQGWRPIGR